MKRFLQLIVILLPVLSIAQTKDTTFNQKAFSVPALEKIQNNLTRLNDKIEKKTLKTLAKLQKQEQSLQKKLALKDSVAAKLLFNAEDKYKALTNKIKHATDVKGLKEYIPGFDSLKTGIKFLEKTSSLTLKFPKEWTDKVKNVNSTIEGLESKMQQANDIQRFIKERKQQLKEQFEKYGLGKQLKRINKEVYYYQQQLNEYKSILKDPKKIEQRAIAELRKLPAFKAFMQKNSQLASLFRLPDNYGTAESLAGLQTRASVQSLVQQRLSAAGSGVNPHQYVQQQMQAAQSELNKLKDKVNKLGGGGSGEIDMPDFKPNTQKTKSFLKRLEYGANVQSQKTNGLLPVTSDLALTAGYKLNDKSVIGIGAAYKLGWGSGWQHVKLTHEGVGLRSYIDWKIPSLFGGSRKGAGSFWITGGYEQNYQHAFKKIEQLKDMNTWQTSGLVGITKKYKLGKKTNNLQLLWDFMSYQQIPRRQPVLFRVGYSFK